jgi:hypothetical protein
VYIPLIEGPIQDKNLQEGAKDKYQGIPVKSILAWPGLEVTYNVGDIVLVGFEDYDVSNPVILGFLKSAIRDNTIKTSLNIENASITNKLNIPTSTVWGDNVLNFNDIFNKVYNYDTDDSDNNGV